MRTLLAILAVCCAASAAPAFVQGACTASEGGGSPQTATFPSAVTSGDTLIAFSTGYFQPTTFGVSDTVNGAFTAVPGSNGNSAGMTSEMFYKSGSAAGSDTVTFTVSGGTGNGVIGCAVEYSGLGSFDAVSAAGCSGTGCSSPSVTTTASDLVLSVLESEGTNYGSTSVASPYNARTNDAGAYIADQGVVGAGTISGGTWTMQFSSAGIVFTAAFKQATTAVAPPCTLATLGAGGCTMTGTLNLGDGNFSVTVAPAPPTPTPAPAATPAPAPTLTPAQAGAILCVPVPQSSPPQCTPVMGSAAPYILPMLAAGIEDATNLVCGVNSPCTVSNGVTVQYLYDSEGRLTNLVFGVPAAALAAMNGAVSASAAWIKQ